MIDRVEALLGYGLALCLLIGGVWAINRGRKQCQK